ncbi:hypothetical protein LOTGIDRAFT_158397 [Lottia gigantea]|uniref:Uncharacterized protein n=1 Tax=Lottia gigantea TaxID=225164 RepID=V4AZZ0_LOTGI|nr:hypothetical protein LOTGIDRAFT_158397 [Lottia gigantea]ESO99316.1 hypothetical protein LOTGIDRAFT_158397 [Lottia gigantea]
MFTGEKKYQLNEIFNMIEDEIGEDSVVACFPTGDSFEITMIDNESAKYLVENGIESNGNGFPCVHFLWFGKKPLIKFNTIQGPFNKGGLNIPAIRFIKEEFRLYWLAYTSSSFHGESANIL